MFFGVLNTSLFNIQHCSGIRSTPHRVILNIFVSLNDSFFDFFRKDNFTFKCHRSDVSGSGQTQDVYAVKLLLTLHTKMKFSIKEFFMRIWSYLLNKSSMENFILCAVSILCYESAGLEKLKNILCKRTCSVYRRMFN